MDQELLHGTVFRWSANAFLINLPFHRDAVQQPSRVFQAESSCLGAIWRRLSRCTVASAGLYPAIICALIADGVSKLTGKSRESLVMSAPNRGRCIRKNS